MYQERIIKIHCMSTLHVNIACQHCMSTLHVNIACQHCMSTLHVNIACQHCMSTLHVLFLSIIAVKPITRSNAQLTRIWWNILCNHYIDASRIGKQNKYIHINGETNCNKPVRSIKILGSRATGKSRTSTRTSPRNKSGINYSPRENTSTGETQSSLKHSTGETQSSLTHSPHKPSPSTLKLAMLIRELIAPGTLLTEAWKAHTPVCIKTTISPLKG
jgi:hypothetical protein